MTCGTGVLSNAGYINQLTPPSWECGGLKSLLSQIINQQHPSEWCYNIHTGMCTCMYFMYKYMYYDDGW